MLGLPYNEREIKNKYYQLLLTLVKTCYERKTIANPDEREIKTGEVRELRRELNELANGWGFGLKAILTPPSKGFRFERELLTLLLEEAGRMGTLKEAMVVAARFCGYEGNIEDLIK